MKRLFSTLLFLPRIIILLVRFLRYRFRYFSSFFRSLFWSRYWTYPVEFPYALADLRPLDESKASEFYSGRFTLSHYSVEMGGESPFLASVPSSDWLYSLHSFSWLRHMVGGELSSAHAGGLIHDWLVLWGNSSFRTMPWTLSLVSLRVLSWCCHCPVLSREESVDYNHLLMRCLVRHLRYLHRRMDTEISTKDRLFILISLCVGVICTSQDRRLISHIVSRLDRELSNFVFFRSFHFRNPRYLVDLVGVLIPLRSLMHRSGVGVIDSLEFSIDGILDSLWHLRHSHGGLGQFNGTGLPDSRYLDSLFAFYNPGRVDEKWLGYSRLSLGDSVVLVDGAAPILDGSEDLVFSGTLSFELSSGSHTFITNCGFPESDGHLYLPYARASAAHSTAILSDTSSSRFFNFSFSRFPLIPIDAPRDVRSNHRRADGYEELILSHDGYVSRYGFLHKRILRLSNSGSLLEGRDGFLPARVLSSTGGFAHRLVWHVRFHISPDIVASLVNDGTHISLTAPDGDSWFFACDGFTLRLEESISFVGFGSPRKSVQIVIENRLDECSEIYWTFTRVPSS